ncbi:MAG TPA: TlpA disulfide reductase family protein, partial [Kofleriaceae bacterium]|nr:TlpA disulfide reductase family protein [Kofleriaceae bacterium]
MSTDPESDGRDRLRPAYATAPPGSSGSTKALLGILLAGTAGMVIFLFVHLSKDGRIHSGPKQAQAECVKGQGDCLPDVSYVDTAGVKYSRESLCGKVVLVNFWATWCHPCQKE